jgi:translocator protein
MDWYDQLQKSPLTPPPMAFRLVWPMLYILMFYGLYKVLSLVESTNMLFIVVLFVVQILLNISWSPIFFTYHQIHTSLTIIYILLIIVVLMTYVFYWVDEWSGIIQIPYIIWLMFASYLNWYIIMNN